MSYWVSLTEPDTEDRVEVPYFCAGGTYVVGGDDEASLNVTGNYGLREVAWDLIQGKTGAESLPIIEAAIRSVVARCADSPAHCEGRFDDYTNADYWKPALENCLAPLCLCESWAKHRPDGVWSVN